MAMKAYRFPGLANEVYLPDWIKVTVSVVDHPNVTNNQKSNAHTRITWHDTGNPNTNAAGEFSWLRQGRPGGEAGGYNGIFDDREIYITGRFDQVTWHAGTPEGNRTSYGLEQAWGGNVNFAKSLEVGAALHGGIIAAKGWQVDTSLVKHQFWYGKWCPGQILNRGIWSQVVAMTSEAAARARAAASGQTSQPSQPAAQTYDAPVPIPALDALKGKPHTAIPYRVDGDGWVALYVGDRVKAAKATPRLRYSSGEGRVGPDIRAGEEFDVDWLLISPDFPDTYYSPWGTRIRAGDTTRVSDVTSAA